ncbi:MAG: hypothetical protein ACC640_06300, partial [bacterium]
MNIIEFLSMKELFPLPKGSDTMVLFYAFGKRIDVFLADDHLVMRYGKTRKELNRNFQILVLDEGEMIMS